VNGERGTCADHERAVVTLPHEIDITNSRDVGVSLQAAVRPHLALLIADLSTTTFLDSTGVREVVQAYRKAHQSGTDLRLVVPDGQVLRILAISGVDTLLPIYPDVAAAIEGKLPDSGDSGR
jgi:anti-sigma B factor antagonist